MILPVIVRPEADEDVLETRAWYEARLEGLGVTFASRVAQAIELISQMPELFGEVAPGIRAAPVRRHKQVVFLSDFVRSHRRSARCSSCRKLEKTSLILERCHCGRT